MRAQGCCRAPFTRACTQVHKLLQTVAPFESTVFKLPARGPAPAATSAMGPLVGIAYALRQELNLSHAAVGLDIQMEVCCARIPRKGHKQSACSARIPRQGHKQSACRPRK